MMFIRKHEGVLQNLGWHDRLLRIVVGVLCIATPFYVLATTGQLATWHLVLMLVSMYPFITGLIGLDPLYSSIDLRSCDTSERNRCGTLPFEMDTAIGRHPIPDSDIEHSLEHSHH